MEITTKQEYTDFLASKGYTEALIKGLPETVFGKAIELNDMDNIEESFKDFGFLWIADMELNVTSLSYSESKQVQTRSFPVATKSKNLPMNCYVFYASDSKKYYLMQQSSCISSHYSELDIWERERMQSMTPLKDGDFVRVSGESVLEGDEGKLFKVVVQGNYSDAGFLEVVE